MSLTFADVALTDPNDEPRSTMWVCVSADSTAPSGTTRVTVLREVSQHTNIRLRHVAELVVHWGRTGEIPTEIRAELEDALDRNGPTQIPNAPPEPQ
ncbi:hypothetical protein SAMN05428938_8137 [Streptomyces sp. KS_5]|nr:hypothetical protein SAMN05428938_8137 [Streptomyces sp. KS_5]